MMKAKREHKFLTIQKIEFDFTDDEGISISLSLGLPKAEVVKLRNSIKEWLNRRGNEAQCPVN